MKLLKCVLLLIPIGLALLLIGFNIWGWITLGTLSPANDALRDPDANRVVMVFGASGSAGDGLLQAAIEDREVERVYVVTRRTSVRIDAGIAAGKVELLLHEDFTDYTALLEFMAQTDTVLWALGTSSLQVDDATYTRIHVDFPLAFIEQWMSVRSNGPRSFHFITGMGTDPNGEAHWAREKGRTEREMAALAAGTGLRTFSYRSAYIRPTTEKANVFHYLLEALLTPGKLVIGARELGAGMLEISARTGELANGTLIDNADSIAYATLHRDWSEL